MSDKPGIYDVQPDTPTRRIDVFTGEEIRTFLAHGAYAEHGTLTITQHRGGSVWNLAIFAPGTWTEVRLSVPSREELAEANRVLSAFVVEQTAAQHEVVRTERAEAASQKLKRLH